ncbi:MAG: hypothetical protein M4579_001596 [Chaenotheca gracillima]|nr:MAG: hypothetical protein M4579_001596 [Chaenotheca gracillima]
MKSVIVIRDTNISELRTEIQDIDLPKYNDDQILIKVVVSGSNPKDWKHPAPKYMNSRLNQGDDIAGVVEAVGANVQGFRPGDRVAGFHEMRTEGGSYAEYAVAWSHTTFHLPDHTSFEEAATLPLAAFTAVVGLFKSLALPPPWDPYTSGSEKKEPIPLVVNGVSSAVGAFAVKIAKLCPGISPIIGTAGGSSDYAREIGTDVVLDYRSPTVAEDIKKALNGRKLFHVFDAVNNKTSVKYLAAVMEPNASYAFTQGAVPEGAEDLDGITLERIWVGHVHDERPIGQDLGYVWSAFFERLLAQKRFAGQPYEVVPKGLEGVEGALRKLMARSSGNSKFLFRIADTPGLGKQ